MNRNLGVAAFVLGLVAVLWVGAGYAAAWHPMALAMTALIGAFYLMGALELHRFQQGTTSLRGALATLATQPAAPARLDDWLAQLHPTLQQPVRQRIEGARVALPGPALTPYLVGLLVMLGMLGTFLGMVVTLNGAVLALESTTDLATIRAALSAPVKGLGLAFGTSVAGVAASAMLGLMSAVCRRDRLQVAQALDTCIAGPLRGFSHAHQRETMFETLQAQARVVPDAVGQLQATMQVFIAQMERQSQAQTDRLLAGQEAFFRHSQSVVTELASSVDRSLQKSLAETARLTGDTLQPLAQATLAGIAREATTLHERVAGSVAQQLDGVSTRLHHSAGAMETAWASALARHEQGSDATAARLQQALDAFAAGFEQRSAQLLAAVEAAQSSGQAALADTWRQALAEHQRSSAELSGAMQHALAAVTDSGAQQSAALLGSLTQQSTALIETLRQQAAAAAQAGAAQSAALIETQARESAALLDKHAQQSAHLITTATQQSAELLDGVARQSTELREGTAQQAAALVARLDEAHAALQATISARDEARQAGLVQSLETMAATLRAEWAAAGNATAEHQQRICHTLEATAQRMHEQAESHARATIGEIAQLTHTAAEAPRAAAEVMGQLRQQLSGSLARDTDLLAERQRIMDTLRTLLDAIQLAATEQRGAIDALVSSSSTLLQQVGTQLTERIVAESDRLSGVASEVSGSALEVGSLGEAFTLGVQRFSESSDGLVGTLQRIESALSKSTARSDEQLSYYVAQAREIIDLSMLSQKQIVEDLQQLHRRQAALADESAG